MGYHTDFTGQAMVTPAPSPDQVKQLPARTGHNFVIAVRDGRIHEVGAAGESGFAPIQGSV